MNSPKPDNVTQEEWDAVERAKSILTEYFQNTAIFINWVNEDGETLRGEILKGNTFALKHHIERWLEGDFEPDAEDDDDCERAY